MSLFPPLSDAHYLTCRIQECAETTRSGPFARSIDISSLVVQDEYIFIQVSPDALSLIEGRCMGEVKLLTRNYGDGFPEAVKLWSWGAIPSFFGYPVPWGNPRLLGKDEGVMGHYGLQGTLVAL